MAIKAGKVLRTASAAARKFQRKPSAFSATPPVTPSSGVGTFLGIPRLPRSDLDILLSKFIRLSQTRVAKKGDFTEDKVKEMLFRKDNIGINETVKLLEGKNNRKLF